MTTPAQAPSQPAPQQQEDADLTVVLATVLVTAVSAEAALAMLQGYIRLSQLRQQALLAALHLVMAMPQERTGVSGSATAATARQNLLRRAQFTVAAAHRISRDLADARARGIPAGQAIADALARERRYFGAHIEASWNRAKAAAAVDTAAWSYGDLLGWNTIRDSRTSAECLAADGKNFTASSQPLIGWPGAVHPHCRCYAGPAHIGARMLPSAQRVLVRAHAIH